MKRLLLIVLIAACAKPQAPPPASAPAQETDSAERTSLMDMAHGGTVVSRTGETMLAVSALRAIDGDLGSFWMDPPGDLPQSMIVALPAHSRIDRVGIRTAPKGGFTAGHVSFEASADGKAFTPIATITSADTKEAQWLTAKPTDASYIRITMVDAMVRGHDVRLDSALAAGQELEPPHPGTLAGCWTVNGRQAQFVVRGSRIVGIMDVDRQPILFDGGFDGRINRLNWIRGNDYGMALLTVAPDGSAMSGMEWHEEAIPMFEADSWFGQHQACGAANASPAGQIDALLRRVGRFPLFALRFRSDGSLDAQQSADILHALMQRLTRGHEPMRFVAHEFRQPSPAANRAFAQRELDALRQQLTAEGANLSGVNFIAQGSDAPRQEPVTEAMRALYSSVDLEIRR